MNTSVHVGIMPIPLPAPDRLSLTAFPSLFVPKLDPLPVLLILVLTLGTFLDFFTPPRLPWPVVPLPRLLPRPVRKLGNTPDFP